MFTISLIFVALLLPEYSDACPRSNTFHGFLCISIDGIRGNDSSLCRQGLLPCRTLSYAMSPPFCYQDLTYIYTLSVGVHYLKVSIERNNCNYIVVSGNGSSYDDTVIQCTNEEGGLRFNTSLSLTLQNFSLVNCSFDTGVSDLNSKGFPPRAALFIYNCVRRIILDYVRISNGSNATALALLSMNGPVTVTNSVFDHNGQGVRVQTCRQCVPVSDNSYLIQIVNCSIKDNSEMINQPSDNSIESYIPLNEQNVSHGGGMSVVLQNNNLAVKLEIEGTNFTGNRARCGGGLFLATGTNLMSNVIQLKDCIFENNSYPYNLQANKTLVTFGGGIRLEHQSTDKNNIIIQDCKFKNNSAFSGGGLSVSPLAHTDTLLNVGLENTQFYNNSGNVGAAIHVSLVAHLIHTSPPNLSITNSEFCGNQILMYKHQSGVGAIYTNKVPITFNKDILFAANEGTALAAIGTYLLFNKCSANFTRNHGLNGGAIALLGAADMLVSDGSEILFSNNCASLYGGAIYNEYIERENLIAYFNCFVRSTNPLQPLNANFTFIDNSATMTGRSIFTTSVLPCGPISHNVLCSHRWTYKHHDERVNCSEEIATEPGLLSRKNGVISTVPGQMHALNLVIKDDFKNNLENITVFAAHMKDVHENVSVDPRFKFISDQKIVINGNSSVKSSLHLHSTGHRVWNVQIPVQLLECPPGFNLLDHSAKSHCTCQKKKRTGVLFCDFETFESFLRGGYWMGHLEKNTRPQEKLVISSCPPGYCNESQHDDDTHFPGFIPVTNATIRKKICYKRTGTLCGNCKPGFGPAINSDILVCVKCKEENLGKEITKYIFTVYCPLLILFSLMIIFGVRLTTGPANAFIFYSQVISSNFNIDADGHINFKTFPHDHNMALKRAYKLLYGLFNLEFVENILDPFCLTSHRNALDIFQLDYLVALTPLAMILIVLVCLKLKRCCVRVAPTQITTTAQSFLAKQKSGEYLLHAFAAFTLLSYTKLGLTSAYIIRRNPVYDVNGNAVLPDLVYFAGQYNVADGYYLARYFFPACFVLAIITLPPLFLLGYPVIWLEKCLVRCPTLWKHYPVDKVHILLDIFQSCYKDDRRYFAGLYFLFRYAINIVYITTNDWIQRFMVQQIVCILLVLLIAVGWPYKKELRFLNYVDLFIFGNLSVINVLSFYIYYKLNSNGINYAEPIVCFVVQYMLVFLPLVYMILYCVWKLVGEKRRKKIQRVCKCLKSVCNMQRNELEDSDEFDGSINHRQLNTPIDGVIEQPNRLRAPPTTSEVIIESSEYENVESGDETLMIRSRARNTYKASKSEGLRPQPPGSTQRSTVCSRSSCGQKRKSSDSAGVRTSHNSGNPLRRPSPLVPILSVEDGTRHYGATD